MRRLIPILVLAVLLTGCKVKVDQGFELNDDGSGTASVVFGFDDEIMEMLSSFSPDGDPLSGMTSDLPNGWDSKEWSEGEFTGIEATTDFKDLDELRSLASMVFSGEDGLFKTFSIEETSDGGFRFEASLNAEALEAGLEGSEGFDFGGSIEDLGDTFFDAEIVVTLPGEVIDHNADQKGSDGTLIWNVGLADGDRLIRAESAPGGGLPMIPIAAGAVVTMLAVLGFMLWKRRSPAQAPTEDQHVAPVVRQPVEAFDGDPFG